jgi:hypothetical protein
MLSITSDTSLINNIYNVAAYVSMLIRMAAVIRKDLANRPEENLLNGVDEAWEQYKLGKGKRITSDEELDAFIDSL